MLSKGVLKKDMDRWFDVVGIMEPLDSKLRAKVAKHAHDTLLGTVSLVEKSEGAKRNSKKSADVLLRYTFPAAGLTDDALRTLILMVLATGGDVRRALVDVG